jgi:DedD protein
MDSQLRTRLIGAAVLIGLAVIFLPIVLDKKSNDAPIANEEIPLDIPAPGSDPGNLDGMQTRTLPINPQAPLVEIDANAPDPVARVDTARARPTVARLASEAMDEPADQNAEGTIQREVTATPTPVAAVPSSATPALSTPPAQRASPTALASAPAANGGRFGVNFGSYGALENAEKLITQLAAIKIKAAVEPVAVGAKSLFRVAARGYGTRGAAEAARLAATTAIDGLNASVLQGDLPGSAPGAPNTAPASVIAPALQGFAVQIGVFGDKTKADELVAQLKAKGFAAFSERVITPGGSTLRVRVGPMLKRPDADKTKGEIKSKLGFDTIVVPYP